MTTHEELQKLMDFDSVIKVAEDGTIARADDVYCDGYVDTDTGSLEDTAGWELLHGFTGQYSYNGPVMHSSEFIGGGLARYILETPGYYVALVVYGPCEITGAASAGEPAGWAIAYKPMEAI